MATKNVLYSAEGLGRSFKDFQSLMEYYHCLYGNNAMKVIFDLEYKGKQFLVGVHFNQHRGGTEVSSVRGLFPKDNAEWLNWISQGKATYLDHQKIKALIAQQRINLADVDYLDLKDVANITKSFVNPAIPDQK